MNAYNPITKLAYCNTGCLVIALHYVKNVLTGLYEPLCHECFVTRYETGE